MADFNVGVKQVENSDGFLGASRGASAPIQRKFAERAGSVADMRGSIASSGKATAGLIEMGGNLYNQAVQTADIYVKEQVDNISRQQTDQVFDEFGVGDASLLEGTDVDREPIPSEIDRAGKNLMKLTEAKNRGNVNENSYWTRMESISRQLRARYPGHRDYIDQKISSIAGGKPANQIVQNLLAEANSGKNGAIQSEKDRLNLIERATFAGLNADGSLSGMSQTDIIAKIGPVLARKENLAQQKTELDMIDKADEQTQKMQAKHAQATVQVELAQVLNDVASPVGKDYTEFMSNFNKYSNGADPSAEEGEMLRTQFGNLRTKVIAGLRSDLADNYGSVLSKQQRAEVLAPAEEWFGMLEESLSNPKNGMLVRLSNQLESWKNGDRKNLLEKSPAIRKLATYNAILDPQAVAIVLNNNAELKTALDREIVEDFLDNTSTGTGPSFADSIRYAQKNNGELGSNVPKVALRTHLEIMANPNSNPKDVEKVAKALYRTENMSYMNSDIVRPNEQPAVYGRFINPSNYETVKRIGGETLENYKSWATGNFLNVFRTYANDLKEVDASLITYNAELGQFQTIPEVEVRGGRGGAQGASTNTAIRSAQGRINVLNAGLRNIMPVLKDQGLDAKKFLEQGFGKMFKSPFTPPMRLGGPVEKPLSEMTTQELIAYAEAASTRMGRISDKMTSSANTGEPIKGKRGTQSGEDTPETPLFGTRHQLGGEVYTGGPTVDDIDGITVIDSKTGYSTNPEGNRVAAGNRSRDGNLQFTPEQGDSMELDEMSSMIAKKKEELRLLTDLMNDGDDEAGKATVRVKEQIGELISDRASLIDTWIKEFRKPQKDVKEMTTKEFFEMADKASAAFDMILKGSR